MSDSQRTNYIFRRSKTRYVNHFKDVDELCTFCVYLTHAALCLSFQHPILSDVLNQMMSKPNEAFVAGKLNHPCQPVMPAIHSRSSPLKSASTEHAYQHKHEQPTNLAVPGRQKPFLSLTKKGHPCSGVHYKVNFNGNSSHQVARIPPLLDNTSVCEDVEQYSLKPARNKSLSSLKGSHSKPYSAGHLSSKYINIYTCMNWLQFEHQ